MAQRWKLFGASVTGSDHNAFFRARLKLTSIYVLILAIILIGFSVILYQSLARNLAEASDDDFAGIESHRHFVESTLSSVDNEIVAIDIIILILAAGVSYVFAGYTLKPIQRSVEAQRIFSENASHELRTPLAVMKNDIEVLLRAHHPAPELIRSTLHSSIEEIDRMTAMAKDLLALSRSENRGALDTSLIDSADVARRMVEKMRPLAEARGITLKNTSSGPARVRGNAIALEHVLMNLLQNAIDHTPAGGSIHVETTVRNSCAVLQVSDTGSGIEEKDIPHIFERFYKGAATTGSGLGLSIVKGLVEQHGGDIVIRSMQKQGTTVVVTLPQA